MNALSFSSPDIFREITGTWVNFELLRALFNAYGYHVELLHSDGQAVIDAGLKYVHNDTCYPALLAIGQLMHALESGAYDPQPKDTNCTRFSMGSPLSATYFAAAYSRE